MKLENKFGNENFEERLRVMENDIKRLSLRIEILYDNVIKRVEKLEDMEVKVGELARTVDEVEREVDRSAADIISRINREKIENKFEETKPNFGLEKEVEYIDSRLREVEERTGCGEGSPDTMDMQVKELLDKIIFLESRMKAMEKAIGDSAKNRPVILE